jgi:hypothetical protein
LGSNKGDKMCRKVVEIKENTELLELPHWFVQKEEYYFNLLYNF